jgi:Mg/Co/Ni transporter MgtE
VRHAWRVAMREATTGMLVGLMVAPIAFGQALLCDGVSYLLHHREGNTGRLATDGRGFYLIFL